MQHIMLLRWTAITAVFVVSTAAQTFDIEAISKCTPHKLRVIDDFINPKGEWLGSDDFDKRYIRSDEFRHIPVITAEVSNIPCAARGCCTIVLAMRPKTTDFRVFGQVFEWSFFAPLYEHLQKIKPEYILDGGGNVGYAATLFALLYPSAQIISVEPDKSNFAIHNMNTHRFGNVHAVNAGLWDKQSFIALNAQEGEWGKMFKEVPTHEPGAVYGTTINALMTRFNFPRIDFAKVDIEGAESRVLSAEADLSWLDNTRVLCTELHDWMAGYYGLKKVSDIVFKTMEGRPYHHYSDGEHEFWVHENVDPAINRE